LDMSERARPVVTLLLRDESTAGQVVTHLMPELSAGDRVAVVGGFLLEVLKTLVT